STMPKVVQDSAKTVARLQKVLPQSSGFSLGAKNTLVEAQFPRHALTGHPWPDSALAASMPLNPENCTSTRPSERGVRSARTFLWKTSRARAAPMLIRMTVGRITWNRLSAAAHAADNAGAL
ncbi:hypothetical protein, partial [Pseudomonas nitroreducens]|uniref:hypothetical protein n=1 Tax=Pseudomonas nitroreducens TaxID=46680 RepID=UPI003CC828D2